MTEAELAALADEIVAKLKGGRAVGRSGGRPRQSAARPSIAQDGVLPLPVVAAPPTARPPVRPFAGAPVRPSASTSVEIAWRGPNVMRAAWTEAQGARRVADFVDHTLLKAEATATEIDTLCAEARQHRFAAVCVNPVWVERCAGQLRGTEVAVCTVIGFPLGAGTSRAKAHEAADAVSRGASEVDMVAGIGLVKSGHWHAVEADIRAVVESAGRALVKVIIESAALTPEEIIKTCALAKEAGADFVKTSTGFHSAGGASVDAVRLMRLVVGDDLGVKASGGVRDCATALAMIAAGASRIGTSSGVGFATCLGPGPLPLAELLKQPHGHAPTCTSGTCRAAGGQPY